MSKTNRERPFIDGLHIDKEEIICAGASGIAFALALLTRNTEIGPIALITSGIIATAGGSLAFFRDLERKQTKLPRNPASEPRHFKRNRNSPN